jgi:ABC-type polysaccharide/polyol phosphate transport system ATPase subunit
MFSTSTNPRKVSDGTPGMSTSTNNELRTLQDELGNMGNDNFEKVDESLVGFPTVILQHLSKTFNTFTAVDDVSFRMYENQIFSLLGHNGAGKVKAYSNIMF